MTKLFLITIGFLGIASITLAQTTTEALLISETNSFGTARFEGTSGAFGALGGDLSAAAINPAGSAVYHNSYGSLTLGQTNRRTENSFFGNTSFNNNAQLNLNQIGAVLVLKNTSGKGPKKISLGLSYHKTNNFRNRINFSGNTSNTIGDFFVGQANGIDSDNFNLLNNETLTDAYIGIGNDLGFSGQQGFLGFQGFLINNLETNTTLFEATTRNTNGTVSTAQLYDISTAGNTGKVTFNFGAELENNLFLGANLNFHSLNYERNFVYDEFLPSNSTNSEGISHARFINFTETTGNGFSADFGVIAKASEIVRLGLSFQTPTFYNLQDGYSQSLETFFTDDSVQVVDPEVLITLPEFSLRTPGTTNASVALVFKKYGFLSFDYSRRDFSNIRFSSVEGGFSDLNNAIENTFKASNTYRLGAEYKAGNWRWRSGLKHTTSPYKNRSIDGDTNSFSLGSGYNWGKWKFDAAFVQSNTLRRNNLFETESFSNFADIDNRNRRLIFTLGVNL